MVEIRKEVGKREEARRFCVRHTMGLGVVLYCRGGDKGRRG